MSIDQLSMDSILSRKHLSGDRMDLRFRNPRGEVRDGRVFPFHGRDGEVERLLSALSSMSASGVHFPDRVHCLSDGRFCLSVPAEGFDRWDGSPLPLGDLLAPVTALHASGWLHLDITPDCFVKHEGKIGMICWGVGLLGGSPRQAPELMAGGPSSVYSDLYMLGESLSRSRGWLWDGEDRDMVDRLSSRSMSIRSASGVSGDACPVDPAIRGITDDAYLPEGVTFLQGGDWKSRDIAASIIATSVMEKGWIARYIRCVHSERRRPLPGRPRPVASPVDSCWAMLREVFPTMGGVQRLLVVDQVELASPDLKAILAELVRVRPPNLALLLTSAHGDQELGFKADHDLQVSGDASLASEWHLEDLPSELLGNGLPLPCYDSVLYRTCGEGALPEAEASTSEELLQEGAYRVLAELHPGVVPGDLGGVVAEALFRLGRYADLLEQENVQAGLAAKAHLALGDPAAAESILREIDIEREQNPEETLLLLAESYLKQTKLTEAQELLSGLSGTRSALLLARTLDLLGRAPEALPSIRKAMDDAPGADLVELLCSESNICMRMGNYSRALEASSDAVMHSRELSDVRLMASSLRERGRVREVLGRWTDALDDYRLSLSYATDAPASVSRASLTDLYVLELKTGDIRSAARTFDELREITVDSGDETARQLIALLSAYRGVLLGLGALLIPEARRSMAIAAEQDLALGHALSMLYLGQLLAQDGSDDEARKMLGNARASAGLMGDQHLILLADLAIAGMGGRMDTSRLIMEAGELGLEMEALEARILCSDAPGELSGLLSGLLDTPSPLKAVELVRLKGLPPAPEVRSKLVRTFSDLSGMLRGEELTVFLARNRSLAEELEKHSSEQRLLKVRREARIISAWIAAQHSNRLDLDALRNDLGLSSLSLRLREDIDQERVSDEPELYASGSDLFSIRVLAPMVAAVAGAGPAELSESASFEDPFEEMIGRSQSMLDLKQRMLRVAGMHVPVLVIGKTGTGKELVARGIHARSRRADGPFIAVDCGAIAENLLESELFGALRGAYTGSSVDRQGLMEAANGGTLFLDEIGNLPVPLQVKLLRVLETGRVRRLGDTIERNLDFRLICATNSELSGASASGDFRADLYYRIAVMILRVPSLSERAEDIPLLVDHFATLTAPDGNRPAFSRDALRALADHPWPGNIRELRNVVQRAVLFSSGEVLSRGDIHFESRETAVGAGTTTLEDCVIAHVMKTVDACGGNRSEASRILRCNPKTVRKYLALGGRKDEPEGIGY